MKTYYSNKKKNQRDVFSFKFTVYLIILLFSLASNASGAEFFVSQEGDDLNAGTSVDTPWQTVSFALSNAEAGDTIYLQGGIWYDEYFEINNSGSFEKPIIITSFNGLAVLDGQNTKETPIKISSSKSKVSNIVIDNIAIKNYKYGVYVLADTHNIENLTITNLVISNCSSIGIWGRGGINRGIIENMNLINNQIKDLSPQSSTANDAGILIYNAKNSTIENNYLENMAFKGIFAMYLDSCSITNNHVGKTGSHSIRIFDSPRTLISHNYIENSGARSIVIDGQKSIGVLIENNYIVDGKDQAFSAYHNTSSKWISNTVVRTLPGWLCGTFENVVDNNTFIDYSGNYGGLIFGEYYSIPTRNLIVSNNRFINFTSISAVNLYDSTNTTIRNNVFSNMKLTGASIYLYYGKEGASKTLIENNVFYDINGIGGNGIAINQEINDLKIVNNIFTGIEKKSVTNNIASNTDTIVVNYNNIWDSNALTFTGVSDFNTTYSDPLFVDADSGNFHLKSINGRWDGLNWIYDSESSPLIDAGDPTYDFSKEISPNGDRINLGVYGNTPEASISSFVNDDLVSSSSSGISFSPNSGTTANLGELTTFVVDSEQDFDSTFWYLDNELVESDTTEHVEVWATIGNHIIKFEGNAPAGTISKTWDVLVHESESEYSTISISPSTTTVAPGESFSLDVYIDPTQALTGSQFDLQYSQLASISTVDEGDLFTASGLATTFQYDSISNAEGLLDNVYAAIVGSGTITSPGVMATIEMVAGSSSGIMDLGLTNVILSDANSNPAGYTVSDATVLIDTAPQFTTIPAKTVEEEQSLSFTTTATDADGDDLSYTATSLPSGATFNGGSFSWTPAEGDAGSYVATFEVTDGYLTDTVNVSITVTPLNHIPEITLFEPADGSTFEEGSIIGVNVAATDADGDSLSYIIEIDGVQVSTSTSYSWTTDYESAGTHTIKVTVSDGTDEVSSSGTITITDLQPRWDVNEDGIVNVLDITLVGQNYGQTYTGDLPRWDVNQDGTVNIQDLSIVSGHFGETV